MNLAQMITAALIGLVIFVNLLNPGGWYIAFIIIVGILLFYAAVEFLPEYLLVTNQGKNARRNPRRRRRARGLNPFSRKSRRESSGSARETQTQSNGGKNE